MPGGCFWLFGTKQGGPASVTGKHGGNRTRACKSGTQQTDVEIIHPPPEVIVLSVEQLTIDTISLQPLQLKVQEDKNHQACLTDVAECTCLVAQVRNDPASLTGEHGGNHTHDSELQAPQFDAEITHPQPEVMSAEQFAIDATSWQPPLLKVQEEKNHQIKSGKETQFGRCTVFTLTGMAFLAVICAIAWSVRKVVDFPSVAIPVWPGQEFENGRSDSVSRWAQLSEKQEIPTRAGEDLNDSKESRHLQSASLSANLSAGAHEKVLQQFSMMSWVGIGVMLCCFGIPGVVACVACCAVSLKEAAFLTRCLDVPSQWNSLHEQRMDLNDKIELILRREMRYVLMYPLVPLLGVSQTTCGAGSPLWVYICFVPLLARAQWVEWKILTALGKSPSGIFLSIGFWLGSLDKLDWMTDGIFPLQAYACDAEITSPFATAFAESWAAPLAPVIMIMRFWGIACVVLVLASVAQQAIAVWMGEIGNKELSCAMAADVSGFGAVAAHFEDRIKNLGDQAPIGKGMTILARVVLENALQLHLQSSFFALSFDSMKGSGRYKVLLSLGLSLSGALYKSATGIWISCNASFPPTRLWAITPIVSIFFGFWAIAKVYFAFVCESHLWNLTSGCVHLSAH